MSDENDQTFPMKFVLYRKYRDDIELFLPNTLSMIYELVAKARILFTAVFVQK